MSVSSRINPCDILGNRYGKLVVSEYLGKYARAGTKHEKHYYLCKCDCGKSIEAARSTLRANRITSCLDCGYIEQEGDHFRYVCENGKCWIFDFEDLELVRGKKWHISQRGYPEAYIPEMRRGISFHVLAMNPGPSKFVDHIDGNTLNNRRSNLRIVSPCQNVQNKVIMPYNQSGFKGITHYPKKKTHQFRATIRVNKKWKHLGYFNTPEEAARAYDEAARYYFGEFACVNFPHLGEQCCRRNQDAMF